MLNRADMKLLLLNQLSKEIPSKSTNQKMDDEYPIKPTSLLFKLQENIGSLPRKQKYWFLGVDKNSSTHRAMEEEMEVIEQGDPILYRKILSLD